MSSIKLSVYIFFSGFIWGLTGCGNDQQITASDKEEFPDELVKFRPYQNNPVFSGSGAETWDKKVRERGYILFEDSIYKMWYTGFNNGLSDQMFLGYATSRDGINWVRDPANPVFNEKWTEDMFVFKHEGRYIMYAEGKDDVAHYLTSDDGLRWEEQGDLVIQQVNGDTIPGPYGTPVVWVENGKWHLFYERMDEGIWLAVSEDRIRWKNVSDEPVIKLGPSAYDAGAVAANQVIKYKGRYYMYYHASSDPDWAKPGSNALWSSNVAMSVDLIHWTKYPLNPIVEGDHSSPILVFDGAQPRLYAMHNEVWLYFPEKDDINNHKP